VSVRPVRIYGDPVLRTRASEVREFDGSLAQFVADLFETMAAYRGVGLAANQVGVLQRVLVVDVPAVEEDGTPPLRVALVNPEIVQQGGGKQSSEEGCLSIPGVWEDVTRASHITVRALDANGQPITLEADGYAARALQHEIDHLDGVLTIDRTTPEERRRALAELRPQPGPRR